MSGRRPIAAIAALALLVCAPSAFGEVECAEEDPRQCSVALSEGDPAPFAGILLTDELALSLNEQIETSSKAYAAERRYLKQRYDIELRHQAQLHRIRQEASDRREKALLQEIERLQPKIWEHPIVVAGLTLVAIGVAGGIAGILVSTIR